MWALPSLAVDSGVPLVLTAHGTDLMGYDKWPEMRHYAKIAMDACVKVICICPSGDARLSLSVAWVVVAMKAHAKINNRLNIFIFDLLYKLLL